MNQIVSRARTKIRKITVAVSGLIVAAFSLGMTATTSAHAYNDNYSNYNNYYRHYSMYRWVYDPCLHRWVLIGYNNNWYRWELTSNYDRYQAHQYNHWSDRDDSYWYND